MWICEAPSSTTRRASAAYSSGVYGIAGHCSRLAITPEIEQLMTTGSSKRLIPRLPWSSSCRIATLSRPARSYGHHSMAFVRLADLLVLRHPQRLDDRRAGLAGVDDVVDDRVAGGDVRVDLLAHGVQHRLAGRLRIVGGLDRRAADDFDRALGAHHRDLGPRPG